MNHFGRCVSVCRPMDLVLNGGEKKLRHLCVRSVVHARSVYVEYLLIESSFARANVTDPRKEFVEVIRHSGPRRVLQTLIVHREPLDEIFTQARSRPLSKLRTSMTAYAVT